MHDIFVFCLVKTEKDEKTLLCNLCKDLFLIPSLSFMYSVVYIYVFMHTHTKYYLCVQLINIIFAQKLYKCQLYLKD